MTSHLLSQAAESLVNDWLPWALGLAIVAVCVQVYGRLLAHVLRGKGKVWTEPLGLPDLLVVLVLITWLGSSAIRAFSRPQHVPEVTDSAIIATAVLGVIVVGVITLFLRARQISVSQLFGFRRASFFQVLKYAGGLLLAAFPLVILCSRLVQLHSGGEEAPQQEIAKFFSEAARHSQWWRMALSVFFGALIAPITEEFIFRGYFYGVLRRYLGIVPAALFTSALFAAIHLSGPAFVPLFVLAGCLTLAYEATGSLLTPMLMHAFFNAFMFSLMIYTAQHP